MAGRRHAALRLWEGNEQFLSLAELADVADTLTGLAGGHARRTR